MVTGLDPMVLGRLSTLELRGNKLETTAGLGIPTLKNLFLVSLLPFSFFYPSVALRAFWAVQYWIVETYSEHDLNPILRTYIAR